MIGKLKGLIDSYGEDHVIIDVQGVGYVVQCSARTLQRLPKPGEAAALSIETHVREDANRRCHDGLNLADVSDLSRAETDAGTGRDDFP